MIKSPLAVVMGEEIRRFMRKNKISQVVLAEHLSLSAFTVSRLLKGKTLFSSSQLEKTIKLLKPAKEIRTRWQSMNCCLQGGLQNSCQDDYTYWRSLREIRCLSLPMLSNLTGIKTSRLSYLESPGADAPTVEETKILKRIFSVSDKKAQDEEKEILQELPLVYLPDFSFYDRQAPLDKLAVERSREKVFWEVYASEPAIAVLADCRELQVAFPGFAVMVVADKTKKGSHRFELCFNGKGYFFLQERNDGIWSPVKYTVPDAVTVPARWTLPVLDIVFKPFDLTIGVGRK